MDGNEPAARAEDVPDFPSPPRTWRRRLRAIRRLVLFVAVTAVLYPLFLLGKPLVYAWPRRRHQWRHAVVRTWSRLALRIFGVQCRVSGTPPVPPFLLVCNHISYLDMLVLGAHVDGIFIAKHEVAGWPILGQLVKSAGTLFVNRRNHRDLTRMIRMVEQAYGEGAGLVFFPEGTSSRGREVLPFRPGLLQLPAARGWPVHGAAVSYDTAADEAPADTHVCWWGSMNFFGHFMQLLEIHSVSATLDFVQTGITDTDRKALASRLHHAVTTRFTPVAGNHTST